MTITTMTHTTAIERAIARLPKGIKAMQQGTWLELALATHGGHCPDDPTQQTKPAWDWVDGGIIRGSWGDGQCGGCCRLGQGWVQTGVRDLSTVSVHTADVADGVNDDYLLAEAVEQAVDTMRSDLDAMWAEETVAMSERIQTRLRRELTAALAELADEEQELDDKDITTGSDLGPGIYRDKNGEWLAWDYEPNPCDGLASDDDCCHTITVYESDLDG